MERSRKIKLYSLAVLGLAAAFFVAVPAQAETFKLKSKIADINTIAGYLKLYRFNAQTGNVEQIKVSVAESTQFEGFRSLRDLSRGDEVLAEIHHDEFSHEYDAMQIGLVHRRIQPVPAQAIPLFQPPLVSGGGRLYQNYIEEEPIKKAVKPD